MKSDKHAEISDRYKLFSLKSANIETKKSGPEYDYSFKVTLLGDSGVGKSSLLLRFVDDSFTESFISSIGQDFKIKTMEKNGYKVRLQIWDVAGQEKYRTIVSNYYRGWHVGLVVFDTSNPESFNNAIKYCKTDFEKMDTNLQPIEDYKLVLVGTKIDLASERKVDYADARQVADDLNIPYIETSAKDNINIEAVFSIVCELLMPEKEITPEPPQTGSCTLF